MRVGMYSREVTIESSTHYFKFYGEIIKAFTYRMNIILSKVENKYVRR